MLLSLLMIAPLFAQTRSSADILTATPPPYDKRIRYGTDSNHFADLRVPKGAGPHPVVVLIHGGFWRAAYDLAYAGHMAADLTRRGYATWNIEYRRIGQPGGGYPGTLQDVALAVDHLAQIAGDEKLDLKNVVAIGHSAGGHLAMWLASRKDAKVRFRRVISLAGVGDLRAGYERKLGRGVVGELIGCAPAECDEKYREASPVERLPLRVSVRLFHGTKDTIVPLEMSVDLERAIRKSGDDVQLIQLEDAGHFEMVDPQTPEWQKVVSSIRR